MQDNIFTDPQIHYIKNPNCKTCNKPKTECNDCWGTKKETPVKKPTCVEPKVQKECACKKTETQTVSCQAPTYFEVGNYFSELVYEWQKEAARYNLGVQELEGIEYVTVPNESGEILTKVIFKYRKGHEIVTREFQVAPKGDKGDSFTWRDLTDEQKALLKGDPGTPGKDGEIPRLNKVEIVWMRDGREYGEFVQDDYGNYNLVLYMNKPDSLAELAKILDQINAQLVANYVTKDYLNEILKNFHTPDLSGYMKLSDLPNYSLEYSGSELRLLKNGNVISKVTITSGESTTTYTYNLLVFKKTNSATIAPTINAKSNVQITEQGWSRSMPTIQNEGTEFVWMATCIVENGVFGSWSVTRLTGLNGKDGSDGKDGSAGGSGSQGQSAVMFSLNVDPSFITFDENDILKTNEINFQIIKTVGSTSAVYGYNGKSLSELTDDWQVIWSDVDGKTHTPRNKGYASYTIDPDNRSTDKKGQFYNGQYLTITLTVNNVIWAIATVPVIKNAQPIVSPYVIRNRGEWTASETYVNESLGATNDGSVKYVDVVSYGLTKDYIMQYYILEGKVESTGDTPNPNNQTVWKKAYTQDFAFIKNLVAEVISATSAQADEVLITDSSNIVAGMTSGKKIVNDLDGNTSNHVKIWAGTTTSVVKQSDLTNAPFRVYQDGTLVASNAVVTGKFKVSSGFYALNKDLNLPQAETGQIAYLIVTSPNVMPKITTVGNTKIWGSDGNYIGHSYTTTSPGVYLLCGWRDDVNDFWIISKSEVINITKRISEEIMGDRKNVSFDDLSVNVGSIDEYVVEVYGSLSPNWDKSNYVAASEMLQVVGLGQWCWAESQFETVVNNNLLIGEPPRQIIFPSNDKPNGDVERMQQAVQNGFAKANCVNLIFKNLPKYTSNGVETNNNLSNLILYRKNTNNVWERVAAYTETKTAADYLRKLFRSETDDILPITAGREYKVTITTNE